MRADGFSAGFRVYYQGYAVNVGRNEAYTHLAEVCVENTKRHICLKVLKCKF